MEWIADNLIVIVLAAALGLTVAIIGGWYLYLRNDRGNEEK